MFGIQKIPYGERDYWSDGSFVTTDWLAIAWIPILPIISKRVSSSGNSNYVAYDPSGYHRLDPAVLNVKQVLSVYGWFGSVFATVICGDRFQDALAKRIGGANRAAGLMFAVVGVLLALPPVLRRLAKRRKA